MPDHNTPLRLKPLDCWAIRPLDESKRQNAVGRKLYWHLADPWANGFYDTLPRISNSKESAEVYIAQNRVPGEPVKGWLDESSGFFEGELSY